MTSPSAMRSLCATAEQLSRLLPRMVSAKVIKQSEAEHMAGQIRSGVEATLDAAINLEAKGNADV